MYGGLMGSLGRFTLVTLAACTLVNAAPWLRLSNTAVVPAPVAVGVNVPSATVQVINIGDGSLSLSVSVAPGADWLSASTAPSGPIVFNFQTASLSRRTYTAHVTVSDPNAIDSPQSITVTVQIGASPASVDHYMAPGSFWQTQLSPLGPPFTTEGGPWVAVVLYGTGTLQMYKTWWIQLSPPRTMPEGTYTGSVTAGSDNIPVTMRLTTQPIAVPSVTPINLRLAQGGPPMTAPFLAPITFTNSGLGTLAVSGATAAGPGLIATLADGQILLGVEPGTLPAGTYNDSVTVQCNAANCPLQIPVNLQTVPPGPPTIAYQNVIDNSTFLPGLDIAAGDVALVRGEQLSVQPPAFAQAAPLPTLLGGSRVLVNGVPAPLFYSSAGQIAFLVPTAARLGVALVRVERDGHAGNTVSVNLVKLFPRIVAVTDSAYRIVDIHNPAKPGDTIILWGIGMGPTNPVVPDGAPAPVNPPALLAQPPTALFYGAGFVTPAFAGLSPGAVGLYQVNVQIPAETPKGNAEVILEFGSIYSNTAFFNIQ